GWRPVSALRTVSRDGRFDVKRDFLAGMFMARFGAWNQRASASHAIGANTLCVTTGGHFRRRVRFRSDQLSRGGTGRGKAAHAFLDLPGVQGSETQSEIGLRPAIESESGGGHDNRTLLPRGQRPLVNIEAFVRFYPERDPACWHIEGQEVPQMFT